MGKTAIQWTAGDDGAEGYTWNPLAGCDYVSEGCRHCYAASLHNKRYLAWKRGTFPTAPRQYHRPFWGPKGGPQLMPERLEQPLHWRKPRRVFVNSVSDLFHVDVPDDYIARVFAVMVMTARRHTYQVLTKRPERMRDWMRRYTPQDCVAIHVGRRDYADAQAHGEGNLLSLGGADWASIQTIWLGTSVEDQAAAYERIPALLATPAAVRFLSCEPLLEPFSLLEWWRYGLGDPPDHSETWLDGLSWVIVGGESGKGARPMEPAWALRLVRECQAKDVPVFVKQMGAVWAKAHGSKDSHGGDPADWPQELRVRQWPDAAREVVPA